MIAAIISVLVVLLVLLDCHCQRGARARPTSQRTRLFWHIHVGTDGTRTLTNEYPRVVVPVEHGTGVCD